MTSKFYELKTTRPKGLWIVVFVHSLAIAGFFGLMAPALGGYLHSRSVGEFTHFPIVPLVLTLTYACTWLVWAGFRKARIPFLTGTLASTALWALEVYYGLPFLWKSLNESPKLPAYGSLFFALIVPVSILWCIWLCRYVYGKRTERFFSVGGEPRLPPALE
jgi:hypothetical protein